MDWFAFLDYLGDPLGDDLLYLTAFVETKEICTLLERIMLFTDPEYQYYLLKKGGISQLNSV